VATTKLVENNRSPHATACVSMWNQCLRWGPWALGFGIRYGVLGCGIGSDDDTGFGFRVSG